MKKAEIIRLKLGGANSYLIKNSIGCILVDAGAKGAGRKLMSELSKRELQPDDIKLIVITHNHHDHIGGLEEIKQLVHAPVVMNRPPKNSYKNQSSLPFRIIVKTIGSITPDRKTSPVKADVEAYDGMDLKDYGFDVKIYCVPGHSEDSICLLTKDGQCVIGDTLFNMFLCTYYPIIVINKDMLMETYRKLDSLNSSVYFPGHGNPIERKMFKKRIIERLGCY